MHYACPECQEDMYWQNDDDDDYGDYIISHWHCPTCLIDLHKSYPVEEVYGDDE